MTVGSVTAPASRTRRAERTTTAGGLSLRSVVSGLLAGMLLVALLAALALALVPRVLGGAALNTLSDSMEPRYSVGDVVVVPVAASEIQVGDVVAFQPVSDDPHLVTHRVVERILADGGVTQLVTRGDGNDANDLPIVAEQVMGRAAYHVPAVGLLAMWFGDSADTFVAVTAVALFGYAAVQLARP